MPPIHYHTYGSGYPVLLLHGFCESKEIWSRLIPLLPDNFFFILPDIPGFGESLLPAGKITIPGMAGLFSSWMDELGYREYAVVGHSMGGYLALALAAHGKCSSITLFHSTAAEDNPEKKKNRTKTAAFIEKNGKQAFFRSFITGLYHQSGPWENEVREMITATSREAAVAYTLAMRDRPGYINFLKKYRGHVLYLAGGKDAFLDPESLQQQSDMCMHGRFALVRNVGHLGMMEAPETCAGILGGFLREFT